MAPHWNVVRKSKIDGKWTDRPIDAIAHDLEAAVCAAAAAYECHQSGVTEEVQRKKAKTYGAREHMTASSGINVEAHKKEANATSATKHVTPSLESQPSTVTVEELPETLDDLHLYSGCERSRMPMRSTCPRSCCFIARIMRLARVTDRALP